MNSLIWFYINTLHSKVEHLNFKFFLLNLFFILKCHCALTTLFLSCILKACLKMWHSRTNHKEDYELNRSRHKISQLFYAKLINFIIYRLIFHLICQLLLFSNKGLCFCDVIFYFYHIFLTQQTLDMSYLKSKFRHCFLPVLGWFRITN